MSKGQRLTLIAIIAVGAALPVLLNWMVFEQVPTVSAAEAKRLIAEADGTVMVLDVRSEKAFARGHLDGAVNWPPSARPPLAIPPREARDASLVLVICESGHRAIRVVRILRTDGTNAFNIRGGMQAWTGDAGQPCAVASLCKVRTADGETADLPFREASGLEQFAAVAAGFGVKPTYMFLTLVLVIVLWRRRSPELVALRWGLIFFFVGEMVCQFNYILFDEQSQLMEYAHSFGMVLTFGFMTYAGFEGVDRRLVKFSAADDRCAALGLCRRCIKYDAGVPCGLRRMFHVILPAMIVLATMPLLARTHAVSYNTSIYGTPYNYAHYVSYQLYEIRFLPVAAIALFAASWLALIVGRSSGVHWAKMLFACGMGAMGFSLLRLFTFAPWRDNLVWFIFWEEVTELLFIAGVCVILWIFRAGLFSAAPQTETP